jgi:hypothetical protein
MSIITISRQLGSLGTEIAQTVSEKLKYEYVDKEKIGEGLAGLGLPSLEINRLDEKKPSFWGSWQTQREKFLHLLRAMIYDFAQQRKCRDRGPRGASFIEGSSRHFACQDYCFLRPSGKAVERAEMGGRESRPPRFAAQ